MNLDNPFPLELVSSRVRANILHEFGGRCPSIREMTQISNKQWLATPGIGLASLSEIRSVANNQFSDPVNSTEMDDAELLERLEALEKEYQELCTMLIGWITESSRNEARGFITAAQEEAQK
jgi:hypothetical protein